MSGRTHGLNQLTAEPWTLWLLAGVASGTLAHTKSEDYEKWLRALLL